MTDAGEPRFGADPKPYYLALVAVAAMALVQRTFQGIVPDDFSAYLVAADVFWSGGNPYQLSDLEAAARWNGKPYNYFPGTLYFIVWMAWVPTVVATTLDLIARLAALYFAIRWLARRILPDVPTHFVFLIALGCEPLFVDVLFGNLVSYLLAAWVACAALSELRPTPGRMGAAALCGVVLSFKPFWLPAAAYCFFLRRNWRGLGALVAGSGLVGGLSLLHLDWREQFTTHTAAMRDYYFSVDFLSLAPPLLVVAAALWAGAALYLDQRGDREWAWLFGCTSLIAFPRLATYSYTFTLPLVFLFIRRWGAVRGLLFSAVTIGPLPWLLRVAYDVPEEGPAYPAEIFELCAHFAWALVAFVVVFWMLRRPEESA